MPKIIGATLADHRVQTRGRLLAAFAELVETEGFEHVSLARVAERAGVGRTALYNHFSGKEDLLLGYIMDRATRYLRHMEESVRAAGDDPVAQLRAYVRDMAELGHSAQLAIAPAARSLISPDMGGRIREHAEVVQSLLRSILQAGIDAGDFPDQDLDQVVPLISSCLMNRSLPREPEARRRALAATESFVLRAVGARQKEARDQSRMTVAASL